MGDLTQEPVSINVSPLLPTRGGFIPENDLPIQEVQKVCVKDQMLGGHFLAPLFSLTSSSGAAGAGKFISLSG